jgi:glycosyltransferase involved in cell wall biosynthesis
LGRQLRICLVTTEVLGPFKNGGIGTATTGLAQWLAEDGHEVTILYTQRDGRQPLCVNKTFKFWQSAYATDWHIELVALPEPDSLDPSFPAALGAAYAVHRWLAERPWDLVIFSDNQGPGYFCIQAKCCGTHYQQTTLAIIAHGSTRWVRSLGENMGDNDNPHMLAVEDAEEGALAFCDVVISPSSYMLGWMAENYTEHRSRRLLIPNILPSPIGVKPFSRTERIVTVDELVFFGRWETRKGIEIFCDAVDGLAQDDEVRRKLRRITFLGRCVRIAGEHSSAFVLRRSYNWPFELKFEISADATQAHDYLLEGSRLAVMPSTEDNLPSVVIECLEKGIPFLAGNVGGAVELVHPDDHDRVLVKPEAGHLERGIRRILHGGARIARPAITRDMAIASWRQFIDQLKSTIQPVHERAPESGQLFELSRNQPAVVLLEPNAKLEHRGIEALAAGLEKAPIVATAWIEGDIIKAPCLDRGVLLAGTPDVPACMVDEGVVQNLNGNEKPGEICRQLILEGYPYLILPEPWCMVQPGEPVDTVRDGRDLSPLEQDRLDGPSLIVPRGFAERRRELQQRCYDAVPGGDILAELDRVDEFGDPGSTLGLMAGFLNRVGRRCEAKAVLGAWINSVTWERVSSTSIKVAEFMETDAITLENILIAGGFGVLGSDIFRLHPNHPSFPDASCSIDLFLFGHSRLKGTMDVQNLNSGPVKFEILLHREDVILSQYSHVVVPGRPVDFALSFDSVAGPIQLRLSTSMADGGSNSCAWANWSGLEFLSTEPP